MFSFSHTHTYFSPSLLFPYSHLQTVKQRRRRKTDVQSLVTEPYFIDQNVQGCFIGKSGWLPVTLNGILSRVEREALFGVFQFRAVVHPAWRSISGVIIAPRWQIHTPSLFVSSIRIFLFLPFLSSCFESPEFCKNCTFAGKKKYPKAISSIRKINSNIFHIHPCRRV